MTASADWAGLSRAIGALARQIIITPTTPSVGVWASGPGLLLVGAAVQGTVAVTNGPDGLRIGGHRIGDWNLTTGRVSR